MMAYWIRRPPRTGNRNELEPELNWNQNRNGNRNRNLWGSNEPVCLFCECEDAAGDEWV